MVESKHCAGTTLLNSNGKGQLYFPYFLKKIVVTWLLFCCYAVKPLRGGCLLAYIKRYIICEAENVLSDKIKYYNISI